MKTQANPLAGARWVTDGGHAWLVVAMTHARQVPGISRYSYVSAGGNKAYLECDCDAARFLAHYGVEADGLPVTNYDGDAPCRRFDSFPAAADHDEVIAWARHDAAVTA